jgi:hypothetical protein
MSKQSNAAAQLFALIDELRTTAEASQEMNRVYRDYIRSQAFRIEALEKELEQLRGTKPNVL